VRSKVSIGIRTAITQGRSDEGSVTVWLAMASFVMIVVVGLAVDLTGQVYAQQRARDIAAQAARTGGQQIDSPLAVRGIAAQIDPAQAVAAAQAYLSAAGVKGTVSIDNGQTLTVTDSDTYQPKFLSIIGLSGMPVTGKATVRIVRVVDGVPQ
jgi:Flp pilus assembly protein TadG